jgi:hypothetical protein
MLTAISALRDEDRSVRGKIEKNKLLEGKLC